ncbi:hypothetical protein GCM10010124_37290 [Pilimelia terevasa]|uniref:Ribonuclease E n=1 Tax=Pilimelia terevasa TaxID=53372 RepID=A0A8J3BQJ6_9ACTN|nr:Rne/Rng family ribonuclease [Pilimelia terevasa]GGK40994.1 hypothetical protein GCM10010124_37290 [Pilimelia terevasa]
MLDNEPEGGDRTGDKPAEAAETTTRPATRRRTRAKTTPPAEAATPVAADLPEQGEPAEAPVKKTTRRRRTAAERAADEAAAAPAEVAGTTGPAEPAAAAAPAAEPAAPAAASPAAPSPDAAEEEPAEERPRRRSRGSRALPPTVLFMPPDPAVAEVPEPAAAPAASPAAVEDAEEDERPRRRRRGRRAEPEEPAAEPAPEPVAQDESDGEDDDEDEDSRQRRRRGRRGRGRGKGPAEDGEDAETAEAPAAEDDDEPLTRRRRRRRRKGADGEDGDDDGVPTVVRIREPRRVADEVQGVTGSTRLEAKRQRRRDGRDQRRTRPPILTESEFLARREAVDRVMAVRQIGDRTQIAVLEDEVLVEHYVTREATATMVGSVYLGKVQNVLPSMEAAFVDVGRGRNAVLYAGEVNWDATGLEGRGRAIEQALRPGDPVLVQVTKDPIGHKGARLTSHIALSGRHLVYVPHGNASGISRKLPDNERKRLRDILKKLIPDGAGVIVRTAAEGATEDELARDVTRLQAQWEDIQAKSATSSAPAVLYQEPDLVIRVVRDLFNEDFRELVIQGDAAYDEVAGYLSHVSPDLLERLSRHTGVADIFAARRIDEQILKGLDRKVYLPSGGHLVIDRTEAMTVVDVNTGKYTGAGGNLEETVTRNNLEAAEEIVRQLRLRDLGGIVVIDFIDMVLESNRELVLRRLTECLGRDRTKHQVTEITSLGLVQMTRKRIGAGLLEAFSENCEHCKGRGLLIHPEPVPDRGKGGTGEKVRAVASAGVKPEGGAGSGRRRGRKAAAEPVADSPPPARVEEPAVEEPAAQAGASPADTGASAAEHPPAAVDLPPAAQDAVDSRPEPATRRRRASGARREPVNGRAEPTAEPAPAGPAGDAAAAAPPVREPRSGSSGIVSGAGAAMTGPPADENRFEGYDLGRYDDPDDDAEDEDEDEDLPVVPGILAGVDDDLADLDEDDEDDDAEPVGIGGRRRPRTRRRTRP